MSEERRKFPRLPVRIYFNKYIDGTPHVCEALEISMGGVLARKIHEPNQSRAVYALEIADPDGTNGKKPLWLCASPVWSTDHYEALSFFGQSGLDRVRLAELLTLAQTRTDA